LWLQRRIGRLLMRHDLNQVLNQLKLLWHELRELLELLLLRILNVKQVL
jgi:hypothetical protein